MPVMNTSGRKLAMIARVERINAGRTSWIACSTDCRGGRIRMAK